MHYMTTRRLILFVCLAFTCLTTVLGQTARELIALDHNLAGNQSKAYDAPASYRHHTPKSYTPFYISHYGRHGSRFLTGTTYSATLATLTKAEDKGVLTALGSDVLRRVRLIYNEGHGHEGELTSLGAMQHRGIAERMFHAFPEIFKTKGSSVDARSTIVGRCIRSMDNAVKQLAELNPQLTIREDSSKANMYYMNHAESLIDPLAKKARQQQRQHIAGLIKPERLMHLLFTDETFWKHDINSNDLMQNLFKMATHTQNSTIDKTVRLDDIFTDEELYSLWQIGNSSWYVNAACSPLTDGMIPFTQRKLLKRIIEEADSCLTLPYPSASLRYGHDGNVLPLACMLQLDNIDRQISLDTLATSGWHDFSIIPMASNIQIIFYKPKHGKKPILVKVLRNECEAHMPVQTAKEGWPYYEWRVVKEHLQNRLQSFEEYLKNNKY